MSGRHWPPPRAAAADQRALVDALPGSTEAPGSSRASPPISAPSPISARAPTIAPGSILRPLSHAHPLGQHALPDGRVGAHEDAIMQDRALDRRVGAHRAVPAEHALRPDVGAADEAALVDQGAGLVARRQRRTATRPPSRSQVASR